ncbi:MAG TPA: glycoside hydrolase family 31 protein [Vicinamibacterales bacterium]|nr:glycoside hydrolase family 31 protein [Vicinamibacterales bacterium]
MTVGAHRLLLLLALSLLVPAAAGAQWASVGDAPRPEQRDNALVFRTAQGVLSVSAVAPEIVRVRFAPGPRLGRDHSYTVLPQKPAVQQARFEIGSRESHVITSALRVTIRHRPLRVAFADTDGNSLDEDDPANGIAASARTVRVWKRLRDDERVYGFGEKNGRLDKRGWKLGGYSYVMWNSDTFAYDASTDPIYASVPFFLVLRNGLAHGIFLDNTFRSSFDIGHTSEGLLAFGADGGELDYYFIQGPSPREVISRYTSLTGRMPLPPLWSLGNQQSRWSYFPESRVRFVADNFRQRSIPADVLWLDIHYLDQYKPFTWDPERFPDPAGLVRDLRKQGFRVVTIIDPHPKKEPGYAPYDAGLAGGHFVTNPDGSIYEAPVWPSSAPKNPGPSVFPDFSRVATRAWWGSLHKPLLDLGVAGIWNDMNEPAVFATPAGTMPLNVRHDNEGQPTDHREIHNLYGMLMTRATHEGLGRIAPDERPFVLTRASFAGGQRYAAVWPGDATSDWSSLRASIPMLAGLGLSGFPFVGADIGGFVGTPSAELYTRWLQLGVFYPLMRTHTAFGTPDQEPWSYGSHHEALNRRAIELRYELLPHIYTAMEEASATGIPAFRPMFLDFPRDPRTYELDEQFMFGDSLLVAPVVREAAPDREIYLPAGEWYDFWTGERHRGGATIRVPVTLQSLPIFVRAGAFVFRQPVVQHTGEMPGQPLRVDVFPAGDSNAALYEDDGRTLQYRDGSFARRRFVQQRDDASCTVRIDAVEGRYRPANRSLQLHVRWTGGEPARVLAGNQTLPRVSATELESRTVGWTVDGSFVIVKQPDRIEGLTVRIEGAPREPVGGALEATEPESGAESPANPTAPGKRAGPSSRDSR